MARKQKTLIEFRCNKCKAYQLQSEEKSNANWNVYNSNTLCECGGKFVMFFDGKPLGSK